MRELNIGSMVFRLTLSMIMGGLIGLEREAKGRPAGFRTYMLVALGATVTMLLGQYLDLMVTTRWAESVPTVVRTDVARLGAQVINGVGFLGAGTVIVTSRQEIKGLTTAAGLWASACMGLAIGAGFYEGMLCGAVLILLCMSVFSRIEKSIISHARNMNIYFELENAEDIGGLISRLKAENIKIYDVEVNKEQNEPYRRICAVFSVGLPKKRQHVDVLARLSSVAGVLAIEEN